MKKLLVSCFYLVFLFLFTVGCSLPVGQNVNEKTTNVESALNALATTGYVENPIIKTVHTADPSPLVYNGRFYIVCGQDESGSSAFNMYSWRLMSSADMKTWTDHGVIAKPTGWMPTNCAWASSLVYKNGKFYFYIATDWAVGVMTATSITGPYTDPLGKALISSSTTGHANRDIDPCCFIDDDGTAYLFWGGDCTCRYVKLNSDMISLSGSVMDVPGLTGSGYTYLEAPFVIKTNSTYFLLYADTPWPSKIRYATSSSIAGPWTHKGVIGAITGTGTNHEGAAYFNNQWWYVYHTEELSNGNPYSRSVCVDKMTISGSTISPITYTSFWMDYYKIQNRSSSKYVDNYGSSTNGANIYQWESSSSYNQQWRIMSALGGTYYKIVNRTTGLCLDSMNATSSGSSLCQYTYGPSYNQQWKIDVNGSYYNISNRSNSLNIGTGGLSSNGDIIQMVTSGSANNQQWKITKQ